MKTTEALVSIAFSIWQELKMIDEHRSQQTPQAGLFSTNITSLPQLVSTIYEDVLENANKDIQVKLAYCIAWSTLASFSSRCSPVEPTVTRLTNAIEAAACSILETAVSPRKIKGTVTYLFVGNRSPNPTVEKVMM
ncbi:hypothetical protein P5673_011631 [Acropora cervicornis]|uniref:Uncharacterized protein n=1 Tax=Acropora cervicornis TaxID=6130 RepID=A0AAD9QP56_ACRCE|nr:hypothetical protein P5673_011631 [Acropora cervicornis]